MNDREIFEQLALFRNRKIPVCLATIIHTAGSTPRKAGAKMLTFADGSTYGSVGGGCGEKKVRSVALRCLLMDKKPILLETDLSDAMGAAGGDVCGGRMRLFIEPFF